MALRVTKSRSGSYQSRGGFPLYIQEVYEVSGLPLTEGLTRAEIIGVAVFCALGLGLELFNTARGHWVYPQEGRFAVAHVPLFVGFMYAAVGVCILRMIRIFDMRFAPFPPMGWVVALAVATQR